MSEYPEFQPWPKIRRFDAVHAVVTEKLDGTNAQIFVPDDPSQPVLAASRNRWLHPGGLDNYGFRGWVEQNQDALRLLGPGRHYGEWWGVGIGRHYGIYERRLSLFNHFRYREVVNNPALVAIKVGVVPLLYSGKLDVDVINAVISNLFAAGSTEVPGWKSPEGVVVKVDDIYWKVTDNGNISKWKATKVESEQVPSNFPGVGLAS